MLEKVFVPVLEEEGPDDILSPKYRVPSHFHKEVVDLLNIKFPEK
jgi:hypothetical protein